MLNRVALLLGLLTVAAVSAQQPPGFPGAPGRPWLRPSVPGSPTITTTGLPQCVVDAAFSATITATGGSGTYNAFTVVTGALPTGFAINTVSNAGVITGTATAEDLNNTFTIQVLDSNGQTDTQDYQLDCVIATGGVLRTGHPRMWITPAGDTGIGNPLDSVRTMISTYYTTDFQLFIDYINAVSTDPTGKGQETGNFCQTACADGIGFALLALMDPAVLNGFSWGGRTKTDYITAGKAHAAYIAAQTVRAVEPWNINSDWFTSPAHSPGPTLPILYDWLTAAGATWTDLEKQAIIEAGIKLYMDSQPRSSNFIFSSSMDYHIRHWVGLVFDLSEVPSGSFTYENQTRTYAEWVLEMQDAAHKDVFDTSGTTMQQGFEGHFPVFYPLGHDPNTTAAGFTLGNSYNEGAASEWAYLQLTFQSLYNVDLATRHGFGNTWALWMLNQLAPRGIATGAGGDRYSHRYGTMTPFTGYQAGSNWTGFPMAAAMTNDVTMKRVMRWIVQEGYDNIRVGNSAETRVYYWPWTNFYFGVNHNGSALAPNGNVPLCNAFGGGWYFCRTGYESADDTMITFRAPRTVFTGGHWSNDFSAFTVEKFGLLVIHGGQNKGSGSVFGVGFQAEEELDHSKVHVVMPGETGGYKALHGTTFAQTGGMAVPFPTGQTGYCALGQYRCNVGAVTRIDWDDPADGVSYARYVYSGMWPVEKVSYSDREFVIRHGSTDHEYIITLDRVTTGNASYDKLWNIKLPFTPTSSAALTTVELGAGFVAEQGGVWTAPHTTTWTMTNAGVRGAEVGATGDYTAHGRLFLKALAPEATWTRVSGDFYEARDAATFAPYKQAAIPITSSTTSGGTTTITLSQGQGSPANGASVLIIGSDDANLNGFYASVTRLTSTTFTVNCLACGTGSTGWMINRLKSDTAAETYGRARLQLRPDADQLSDLMLVVLQWGDSDTISSMAATTLLCSSTLDAEGDCTGELVGVEIADSVEPFVFLASTDTQGGVPTLPASVTLSVTGSIDAYAINFTPGTTYYWKVTGSTLEIRSSNTGFAGTAVAADSQSGALSFSFTR